ncbi:putative mutator protein MutT4 [Clarias magur]|uniref:Putative mutator protein MutT4 n=1 Tax=Clarias magur TaxID=1594786 RepID=A0A8J4XCF8_CLAMG|nr:putative mutator protein MutT4 [Clarias magur]
MGRVKRNGKLLWVLPPGSVFLLASSGHTDLRVSQERRGKLSGLIISVSSGSGLILGVLELCHSSVPDPGHRLHEDYLRPPRA